MTAKLNLIIEAGKVEMMIMSSSASEEKEARLLKDLISKDVKRIRKKVEK
ncbi:MAG: hypothetical protein WCE90_12430 [Candidatus Zixiibacteriota bacterium]